MATTPSATAQPAATGTNVLQNILNSPLYSQALKTAYLTEYLPGLTTATYDVEQARAQEVMDNLMRSQMQREGIRNVASDYAARGMRTPNMVTRGFAPIQAATARQREAAQQNISGMQNRLQTMYGINTGERNFMNQPAGFGTVGAAARQQALANLLQLPQNWGLTQVAQPSAAPSSGVISR